MNDIENRLRTQLPELGEEIDPSPHMPARVGTRVRRRRALTVGALGVAGVLVALTATAVVGTLDRDALDTAQEQATTPGKQSRQGAVDKVELIEARQAQAEKAARSLVDALGRFCADFDFFFKHDMARGAFRPVRCSLRGDSRTVLFAYGFDTSRTQEAWVSEWGGLTDERGITLVEEGTWAVEVIDPSIVEEVRSIVLGSP
jgi:hypothetical protein